MTMGCCIANFSKNLLSSNGIHSMSSSWSSRFAATGDQRGGQRRATAVAELERVPDWKLRADLVEVAMAADTPVIANLPDKAYMSL
jgi:hypothetical protein